MCVYVPTGGGLGKGGRAVEEEEEEEEEESCIESKHFPSSPSPLLFLMGFGLKGREEQVLGGNGLHKKSKRSLGKCTYSIL